MIRVERSVRDAGPGAVGDLLEALDSRQGAWLGCDVEAEGLYRRESMGCVDPALGFYLDGTELRVFAWTPVGHALLEHVRALAEFVPCPGGLVATFRPAAAGPHPSVGVLRRFLALFGPAFPELALFGAFSFDYYRLSEGSALPDDRRRRVVLYFPERVLVSSSVRMQWVEFSFPELKPVTGAIPAPLDPARLEGDRDDLEAGGHARAVEKGIEKLRRGELFSLVLSQSFRRRASVSASASFKVLRSLNPYPAMFFLNLGAGERLFGASPDLQVRTDGPWVESAPVCGTFRRGTDPISDADQALALLNSDKENAALAACADSDRNDKAKVCEPGSVEVVSRRRVHFFSTIIHTIDHIRGRRRRGVDALDILLAHSTPATVTGLPKPAAIAAIEQIECGPRGWYAGAVARLGSDTSMEALTILRAATVVGDIAEVRTGGNLLVDSDPGKEEEETRLKAETLFRVLAGESPRPPALAVVFERRFKASLFEAGDPMGPLLSECLTGAGCELVPDSGATILVLGDGPLPYSGFVYSGDRPVLAIGASALALLQRDGARVTALDAPRYARRVTGQVTENGFVAGPDTMDLGLYTSQVIESKELPASWRGLVSTAEGWVIAARSMHKPQVAILCRPDSVQSLKGDAGRRLVHAALAWLAAWKS